MMKIEELSVIYEGRLVGRVARHANSLSFTYAEEWCALEDRFPLSISMPLSELEHGHAAIDCFLWGLLPDNTRVVKEWAKKFQTSAANSYGLIKNVGQDCAGAVQFIPREDEEQLLGKNPEGNVQWLTAANLQERMELLLKNHSISRTAEDEGQFSLAGAQPKTALYFDEKKKKWGVPSGRIPTTHILKPSQAYFEGHAENECFCLNLATRLGLSAASSRVILCGDLPVIVVERFDRCRDENGVFRIHQEDLCQALSYDPSLKYQSDGGPTPPQIAQLFRNELGESGQNGIQRFADALILNWLIKGTDAHAKNYSLLLVNADDVFLAPLYDLASALPYPGEINPQKARLAMKIGSESKIKKIERRHWEACAKDLGLKPAVMLERIASMVERMPEALEKSAQTLHDQNLTHPVIGELVELINANSKKCLDFVRKSA
jgi:serine/threonine-protein kinase HipA